jgi:hypothetical protein
MSCLVVNFRNVVITSFLLATHCGTLASPAGGAQDLPSNRTGPFRELTYEQMNNRRCAAVDFTGLLDEPSVLPLTDGRIVLYATRVHNNTTTIARTVLRDLGKQVDDPVDVLTATLPWQDMAVSSPGVCALPSGGFAMAYSTRSGVIGIARSTNETSWQSFSTPSLEGSPTMGETTALRAPSLVCLGDGSVVMAYASAGSIWLARAPRLEGPWIRVDAKPQTPQRDAVLTASNTSPGDAGSSLVGFESGAVDDPELTVETITNGRTLWRLYYTARSAAVAMDGGLSSSVSVSMAASWDGVTFVRFGTPIYTSRGDTTVAAPSVLALDGRRTVMYTGALCELSRGRRGVKASVSPLD